MQKRKITDEMITRGFNARVWVGYLPDREVIRDIIDAALNPPPEEDIPVSLAMVKAAQKAWKKHEDDPSKVCWTAVFRSMERVRRQEQAASGGSGGGYAAPTNIEPLETYTITIPSGVAHGKTNITQKVASNGAYRPVNVPEVPLSEHFHCRRGEPMEVVVPHMRHTDPGFTGEPKDELPATNTGCRRRRRAGDIGFILHRRKSDASQDAHQRYIHLQGDK